MQFSFQTLQYSEKSKFKLTQFSLSQNSDSNAFDPSCIRSEKSTSGKVIVECSIIL